MKKTYIIIGSIVLLIILLGGAWWYLLMNGRPASLSSINPFGSSTSNQFATSTATTQAQVPTAPAGSLRKISTTPVAGAVVFSRDGAEFVRFVERGTGHIFEVAAATGATTRITGTTIPRTTRAIWSPAGSRVVLVTETASDEERLFAGSIEKTDQGNAPGEGTLSTIELDPTARNVTFASTSDSIYYTTPTAQGSTGYSQNLKTNARTVRFTSPLRDITTTWGSEADASLPIIAYTTPTAQQLGYAYVGTGFTRLVGGLRGLMVIPTPNHRILSYAQSNSLISRTDTLDGTALAIPVFPEKCAADPTRSTTLWCGAPLGLAPGGYPDLWYQGAVSFDDSIWKLDIASGNATLVSVPSQDVKEAIDVTDMHTSSDGTLLIFINKKDGALWLQEIH